MPTVHPSLAQTLLLALAAFLVGSIPFGYLIGRLRGIDIRQHGSGNIGATNVARVLGKPLGRTCFALDVLKGLLPTLAAGWYLGPLGHWSLPPATAWAWIGITLAPILGHIFCPWLGFKGGKGVATALGAMLGLFPVMAIAGVGALLVFIAVAAISRYVSLASILAGLSLPIWIGIAALVAQAAGRIPRGQAVVMTTPFGVLALILACFVVYTHRANIKRLRLGTEPRWNAAAKTHAQPAQSR